MARAILVAFDGAQGLDVFGPAEVFAAARQMVGTKADEVVLAAVDPEAVRTTSGVALAAVPLARLRPNRNDTVLVVGGEEEAIRAALASAPLLEWLRRAARSAGRIGSVCSGAFLLAAAGILDGRSAATHWSACKRLALFRRQISVDANAIFVRDGNVWTSAGVTTGIDMALAMVEEDHGRRDRIRDAARLVLYARRPGFQSQFSDVLVAQTAASDPLAPVVSFIRKNLRDVKDTALLARRSGMSVRSLYRKIREQLDSTPAKLVERLRVEQARTLLATTALGTKTIASRNGFGSAARMAAAFERSLGMTPREYRLVHGPGRDESHRV
jgi:transcriptional regulator GlxA family with amidase domain